MTMKKTFLILTLICGSAANLWAVYSENFPITVAQPDGTKMTCYITGDEFYNWLHDAEGYTIVRHPETGYLVYAQLENDALVATQYIVGVDDPKKTELTPWTNISARKRGEIRRQFLENASQRPILKTPGAQMPRSKTMNNIVVYIRFNDQEEFPQDTTHFWNMFNSLETPETASLRNYFQQMSYNKIDIVSHFFPNSSNDYIYSIKYAYPRSYFMPYDSETNPDGYQGYFERWEREQEFVQVIARGLNNHVPADLNVDFNNDGYVDDICFIIRGEPTEWNTLLWPHQSYLYDGVEFINGKRVWDYNILIESHLDIHQASVITHETYHVLGAPDLYRYEDKTVTPIGKWDLMASNTNPPQSTAAYMKYKYGNFINDIPVITAGGTYTIFPVWNDSKTVYKIPSPNSATEFFTVEFRDNTIFWDQNLPGSGLLIYRIVSGLRGNAEGPPDEMYIFRPDEDYPNVDGRIEDACFSADVERTVFNATSNPACVLSDGSPGGIEIRNISAVGDFMTFEVNFNQKPKIVDFTADAVQIDVGGSVQFQDISSDFPTAWMWEFEGGTPQTSDEESPVIRYETVGNFKVKLTVSNEFGSSSLEKEDYITVKAAKPVADFEADNVNIFVSESVKFKDLSQNLPTEWEWFFQGGTPETSRMQNPTVSYSNSGTFDVTLTATNEFGSNTKIMTDYITVLPVSIDDMDEIKILAIPNPNATGLFILKNKNIPFGSVIQVYDMLGRNMTTKILNQEVMNIDLTTAPSGVYFLKITNKNFFYTMKLIKRSGQ